jgi:histone acetyltransferase (RNA polymerase elongator complex component)
LEFAENFSKEQEFENLSVISWVGVREYYHKNGYNLQGTYMVKSL